MTRRMFLRQIAMTASMLFALVVGAALFAPPVSAQSSNLTVTVILASNAGTGVDSTLSAQSARLSQQFGQFNSFARQSVQQFALQTNTDQPIALPGNNNCTIRLLSVSGTQHEFQIEITGGSTTVRSPAGSRFFVAGPTALGGTLILMFET